MNKLTFGDGLKASDVTPEDVRSLLQIPTVEKVDVAVNFNYKEWKPAEGYKALMNAETGTVYNVVTDSYRFVPHEVGIIEATKALEKNPDYTGVEWNVEGYSEYKRMHARGDLIGFEKEVEKGDFLRPTVEYCNNYDYSGMEKLSLGGLRLVCLNGAVVREQFMMVGKRHVGAENPTMQFNLTEALVNFSLQTNEWKSWSKTDVTPFHMDVVDDLYLTKKERAEVSDNLDTDMSKINLWMFYNILTFLITHKIKSFNRRMEAFHLLRKATSRRWG